MKKPFTFLVLGLLVLVFSACRIIIAPLVQIGYWANVRGSAASSAQPEQANTLAPEPNLPPPDLSGQILFQGKTVLNWLGGEFKDLRAGFGPPDFEGYGAWEGMAYGFIYDGITFVIDDTEKYINFIDGSKPELFSINGTALDLNRDELAALVGGPSDEGWFGGYTGEDYGIRYRRE
jgi:hypothetical protein